jgi:hypothetical protein
MCIRSAMQIDINMCNPSCKYDVTMLFTPLVRVVWNFIDTSLKKNYFVLYPPYMNMLSIRPKTTNLSVHIQKVLATPAF